MSEETKVGTMEAFSFRKGVVKISGRWIRFGPEAEGIIRGLSVGDAVNYLAVNGVLKRIEKAQATPRAAAPAAAAQPKAPVKAQEAVLVPTTGKTEIQTRYCKSYSFDDRNRSIERQVALKAAVELAGLYGYRSTKECLDVAATFAAWIEADYTVDVNLPHGGAAEAERGPSP